MPEIVSRDAQQTRDLGRRLGKKLRAGDIIELEGPLGAGKTELVRGLAHGLSLPDADEVQSPTFTIVNAYPGPTPLYHIDLYRVHDPKELQGIGLEEYLYGDGVSAIEWLSLCPEIAPPVRLRVALSFAEREGERHILIEALGGDPRLEEIAREVAEESPHPRT